MVLERGAQSPVRDSSRPTAIAHGLKSAIPVRGRHPDFEFDDGIRTRTGGGRDAAEAGKVFERRFAITRGCVGWRWWCEFPGRHGLGERNRGVRQRKRGQALAGSGGGSCRPRRWRGAPPPAEGKSPHRHRGQPDAAGMTNRIGAAHRFSLRDSGGHSQAACQQPLPTKWCHFTRTKEECNKEAQGG